MPPGEGPLAVRMRPATLDELVGQEHLLGPGSALRTAIEEGRLHSMVLYGPPGSGKTTLARIIAATAQAAFEEESAVNAGKAQVAEVIERAAHRRSTTGEPTIFFLDEIHRFNKAQQDALLPAVEEGLLTLIGATTENPYFEVNSALLSRTQVYELRPLSAEQVVALLRRALERGECGDVRVGDDVLEFLAMRSGGDARAALSGLELACETAQGGEVTLAHAEDAVQRKAVRFDREGDQHYDYISAWIKATRARTPTPRSTTWRSCSRAARTRASSPAGWSSSPPRTSATRTRARWRWPSPPLTPSSTSACPSASSTSPRPRSTCRWRRSRTPPSARSARPGATSANTAPSRRPTTCAPAGYELAKQALGRGVGYE